MDLKVGQLWISKTHPWEDFKIYDEIVGYCDCKADYDNDTRKHAQKCITMFWSRINIVAYEYMLINKIGRVDNTYPYANCGECLMSVLKAKIRKYNMTPAIKLPKGEIEKFKMEYEVEWLDEK